MKTYKEFQPTMFDPKGSFLPDQGDWLVIPVMRTRDSNCLSESNFEIALKMLGGEMEEAIEVHRFGHWGPGWFEIILVNPENKEKLAVAEEVESSLENYPVLDDNDFSRKEVETAIDRWMNCGRRERIEICKKYHTSIFASRRDELPDNVNISELAE